MEKPSAILAVHGHPFVLLIFSHILDKSRRKFERRRHRRCVDIVE